MGSTGLTNAAGLNSLSGFSYQIKVFIYQLTQMQPGQYVEFETLDDVAVTSLPKKDSVSDSCFKREIDENGLVKIFQVKQSNVSESVGQKILYNWLLAYNLNSEISKFTLYIDNNYKITAKTFTNGARKEYKTIIESDNVATALITQVKQIYEDSPDKFEQDYQFICDNYTSVQLDNIDNLIEKQLVLPFHATAQGIGNTYYKKRIEELFTRICAYIMENAGRRKPFVCSHAEYMYLCEAICNSISPTCYTPDYESFKRVFALTDITTEMLNSREYEQLGHCKLSSTDILEHLRWEEYYKNLRHLYLSDAKRDSISQIESIAHQNHKDVVLELQEYNSDTPRLRLLKTKAQDISVLNNEFSRWGTYIYLTQESLPNQISWKDESVGTNEE